MRSALTLVGLFVVPLVSCNLKPEPQPPFDISIKVLSDGHPLPGAVVTRNGKDGPITGPDGTAVVKLAGQEGEVVDLMVRCPAEYVSPIKPIGAGLRHATNGKLPEYETSCPPSVRHLVIAVRADNGPNLPVKILDRVVGRTDVNGAFTYALPLRPGDDVELMLDTTGIERIKPQNPRTSIVMKSYDDVVTFNQKFVRAAPPPPPQIKRNWPTVIPSRH